MQMSDAEVTHMIAVADPYETGEIDFEHFCYVVLQISQQEFIKCIQAHIQKPIQVHAACWYCDPSVPVHVSDLSSTETQQMLCMLTIRCN
jgi:hypothetical protein